MLLTMVVEIMSCFGLASLRALNTPWEQGPPSGSPAEGSLAEAEQEAVEQKEGSQHTLPQGGLVTFPETLPEGRRSWARRHAQAPKQGGIPPSLKRRSYAPSLLAKRPSQGRFAGTTGRVGWRALA